MKYTKIETPAAWNAVELARHPDWIYSLSAAELNELNDCLLACRELPVTEIKQSDFPLRGLKQTIEGKFSRQLEMGLGALLIKGIDASQYTDEDMQKLLWGMGLYFGRAVSQSTQGELLHEVKDEGYRLSDQKARGTNTNIKLWFHNDSCDVAALMCVRQAPSGGESQLVSSVAIHNAMLDDHKELLSCLYRPYYFMRHNVNTTQQEPYHAHPIFAFEGNHFACNILRPLIDKAQALPQVPQLTEQEVVALDVFEQLAHSDKLCHTFSLEPGDVFLVNNFVTLHSRKAFEDDHDADKKRLLLRLWLSTPNSRPLPASFSVIYHHVAAGEYRGGILPENE